MSSPAKHEKEILTYALLDTQSNSNFNLGDLVNEINVDTQSVQLNTMTAVDTVITLWSTSAWIQFWILHTDTAVLHTKPSG